MTSSKPGGKTCKFAHEYIVQKLLIKCKRCGKMGVVDVRPLPFHLIFYLQSDGKYDLHYIQCAKCGNFKPVKVEEAVT